MNFASDNAGPAAPEIMAALIAANEGYAMPYGNDPITARAVEAVRALFEAPEASVHLVGTGTAANALALALMTKPWQAIYCHEEAHIAVDECGAPEFFSNGAKLSLVPGAHGKMTPETLRQAIAGTAQEDVHSAQRGPVSLTQATEAGTVYSLSEIKALTDAAKTYGLQTHLDGARFANACAALGCSPAEMTWKAGIDAVSFGGTKNGCPGVEAVIFFDPAQAWEFELRRKRGGHLSSKHRYLSAQMAAYVEGDLWRRLAEAANRACADLAEGLREVPGAELAYPPEANIIFADLPRAAHRRAKAAGAEYYLFGADTALEGPDDTLIRCRLVCDWSCSSKRVQALLDLFRGA